MDISSDIIAALQSASHIVAFTGAGISAESGVPTFRQAQTGLWEQYDPTELATPQAFQRDPRLVWEWYQWRRDLIAGVDPNPGHIALVQMEQRARQFTLISQNVDDLHERAGSTAVLALHGKIHRTKRFNDGQLVESWPDTGDVPPRCPETGGLLRPDVVWFGESLPAEILEQAFAAARNCDLFLSIGTSAMVQPAAQLPIEALRSGARVLEINPEPTPLSGQATWALNGPSGEILPVLVARAWPQETG